MRFGGNAGERIIGLPNVRRKVCWIVHKMQPVSLAPTLVTSLIAIVDCVVQVKAATMRNCLIAPTASWRCSPACLMSVCDPAS